MRLVFLGSPQIALPSIKAIHEAGHDIVGVITQPDRPKGRKLVSSPTPIKKFALENQIKILTPTDLNNTDFIEQYKELKPEINVVVAYGRIIPTWLIEHPAHDSINAHASLLPKWRGAAPIRRALMAGDKQSGVTIQQVVEKLDAGDILLQEKIAIEEADNNETMSQKVAAVAAKLLLKTLDLTKKGDLPKKRQDESKVSYAQKLEKDELKVSFSKNAVDLENIVKGLAPKPGAFIEKDGRRLKILKAKAIEKKGVQGRVLEVSQEGIVVGAKDGSLLLQVVQREGSKQMAAFEYAKGHQIKEGDKLSELDS